MKMKFHLKIFVLAVKQFLLLSRVYSIRAIDMNRDSNIEARPPIVPNRRMIISDSVFDYEQKLIYFYSQTTQMIYSSKMDGESKFTFRYNRLELNSSIDANFI